jgi:presequence protease
LNENNLTNLVFSAGTYTGGIDVSLLTTAVNPKGSDESVVVAGENLLTKLIIQGKATTDNTGELFSLFNLVLTQANLDSQSKVIEILKETKSRLQSRIQSSGHTMVNSRMKARYSVSGFIDENLGGISYFEFVKSLLEQAQSDWPSVLARLEGIRATILKESICRSGMILDVTGEANVLKNIQHNIDEFLTKLPGDSVGEKHTDFYSEMHPWVLAAKQGMEKSSPVIDEGFVVPTQVSYVGKGYLWDNVRVIGGAYGGFCVFSPFSGLLSFLSYRDPNLEKTIDVYDNAAVALTAAAEAMENDPEALATAIIGAIGDMDKALSPDQKGYTAFQRWLINESAEYRQKYRTEILETKPSDFRDFAERLRSLKNSSVAVVASKEAIETASKAGKKMEVIELF